MKIKIFNLLIEVRNSNKVYTDITTISVEEFNNIRESIYAVKTSDMPSAFQAKEYFSNNKNVELVIEKLRTLLLYSSNKNII